MAKPVVDSSSTVLLAGGAALWLASSSAEGERRTLMRFGGAALAIAGALGILSNAAKKVTAPIDAAEDLADRAKAAADKLLSPAKPDEPVLVPVPPPARGELTPANPARELSAANEGHAIGIVAGALVSSVVAAITNPVEHGSVERTSGSYFPVRLVLQSYEADARRVLVQVELTVTRLFGTDVLARQVVRSKDTDGQWLVRAGERRELDVSLDAGSSFELGDLDVTAVVFVNGVRTQTTRFEVT